MNRFTKQLFVIQCIILFLLCSTMSKAQPVIQWQKTFGGNGNDIIKAIVPGSNGALILAGTSCSFNGSPFNNQCDYDFWIQKVDASGINIWDKTYGGTGKDVIESLVINPDGSIILTGYSNSTDGDVGNNKGGFDAVALKLDSNGNLDWINNYGGSDDDFSKAIVLHTNGELFLAGNSSSSETNFGATYGRNDYCLIKIDPEGNQIWQKQYGGSKDDVLADAVLSNNGSIVLAGSSKSNDHDLNNNMGTFDAWLLNVDANGSIIWSKEHGGTHFDVLNSLAKSSDGGYIATGYTQSQNSLGNSSNLFKEIWVLKLDNSANVSWTTIIGGSNDDIANAAWEDTDAGFLIASTSSSDDNLIPANNGEKDILVSKLDNTGQILWSENYGGTQNDEAIFAGLASDGGYIFAGNTLSTDVDINWNNGCMDGWILRTEGQAQPPTVDLGLDLNVCPNSQINLSATTACSNCSFLWDDNGNGQFRSFTPITTTSYAVTITDQQGLTATDNVQVVVNPVPTVSEVIQDVSCSNSNNGSIDVTGDPSYSYNWSNGQSTEDIQNLGVGFYNLTVTDNNNCNNTYSFSVIQSNVLNLNGSVTDTDCNNGNTGAIDVTPNGGIPGYSYLWDTGDETEDLIGLDAGTYIVTVTDAGNCQEVAIYNVGMPSTLNYTDQVTAVACHNEANGSIDLNVWGGNGQYSYQWDNGAMTQDINNLSAGTYTVTINDGNGCEIIETYILENPPLIEVVENIENLSCNNANDGSIELTVSGGNNNYSFQWSNGQEIKDIYNLPSGNYSVSIYDNNQCLSEASFTITSPPILILTETIEDPDCAETPSGNIFLSVTGGTSGYDFQWSNGTDSQDLLNVGAGNYTVTVIDNNNCIANANYVVNAPNPININIITNHVSCFGNDDGAIQLTVSGGSGGFNFNWNTGDQLEDLSNLSAGNYIVTITDNNNCQKVESIQINEMSDISITSTLNPISCAMAGDASIELNINGGAQNYTYQWDNGSQSKDIFNLTPGQYNITVTDSNNCTKTASFSIDGVNQINVNANLTDASCNGVQDGGIDITTTGGSGNFTYLWSTGVQIEDLQNVSAGSYSLTITDSNNCQHIESFSVSENSLISIIDNTQDVSCNGNMDGSIDLTISGGTGTYNFSWDNGQDTEDISSLEAGIYTVSITDGNSCERIQQFEITTAPPIEINAITTDNSCPGSNDGSIDLIVSGGSSGYTFDWNNNTDQEDLNNLPAGNYEVSVTDSNDCESIENFTIEDPTSISIQADISMVDCFNANNGAIDINVSGGNGNYAYLWDFNDNNEDQTDLSPGQYSLTVTDGNDCTSSEIFEILESTEIQITEIITATTCSDTNDGTIDINVIGGAGNYAYNWSNGLTTEDQNNLSSGTYNLTVTDDNNCQIFKEFEVAPSSPILSTVFNLQNIDCNGDATGQIDIDASGGSNGLSFTWSNNETTEDLVNIPAGNYDLTITDGNQCSEVFNYSISENSPIATTINLQNASCGGSLDGIIDLTTTGGDGNYTYFWNTSETNEDLIGVAAGSYEVTITDAAMCTIVESIILNDDGGISSIGNVNNTLCAGSSTGSIDITPDGGSGNYTFSWSNNTFTEDINNVPAGNYQVTITDNSNCSLIENYTIEEAAPYEVQHQIQDVSCNGEVDGSISILVNGNNSPFDFQWDNGQNMQTITALPADTYIVSITDSDLGCLQVDTFMITEPDVISSNAIVNHVLCLGDNNGMIELQPSGGTADFNYLWETGETGNSISNLSPQSYMVTITDTNNCQLIESYDIDEGNQIQSSLSGSQPSCYGFSDGIINVNANGGTGELSYLWNTGDSTASISNLPIGNYNVSITDENNCSAVQGISLGQPDSLVVDATLNPPTDGTDGSILLTASGGESPYGIIWSNGTVGPLNDDLADGSYTATITDFNGCQIVETYWLSTSLEDLNVMLNFEIFPNPNTGNFVLQFELSQTQHIDISIINDLGQTLQKQYHYAIKESLPFDLNDFPAGIYFIKMQSEIGFGLKKIIILE